MNLEAKKHNKHGENNINNNLFTYRNLPAQSIQMNNVTIMDYKTFILCARYCMYVKYDQFSMKLVCDYIITG